MGLNIWLIASGEPLEYFGERPHRVGMLSRVLRDRGHDVAWWTTTFDHQHKKYFFNSTSNAKTQCGVNMVFLHSGTPYFKNISYARIKNHLEVANEFRSISNSCQVPNVIFCAYPTIDLAYEATKFAVKNNVPIVIDIRDLWPRIFLNPFPKIFHPIVSIFLFKYNNKAKYVFENCTSIIAVSEKYLNYGLYLGKRAKSKIDLVYPLAFHRNTLDGSLELSLRDKYKKFGLDVEKTIVWFVGTFGQTYDLTTVIKAAKKMQNQNNVQFVFTGDGEMFKDWALLAEGSLNTLFTGWVNAENLAYLSSVADIGLLAYKKNAPQGLPNKIFEYLSAGIPILSSLEGESKFLLKEREVGLSYEAGNVDSFIQKLKEYIDDSELMNKTSRKCTALYEKSYSTQNVYGDLATYLEVVAKK